MLSIAEVSRGFPKIPFGEFKIYVSAQTDDDFPYVLKYAGENNIVIGTDYGHSDASSEVDATTAPLYLGRKHIPRARVRSVGQVDIMPSLR